MALAALAASFFLALLCGLFYNAWTYEVDRILREEGGWQARLTLPQTGAGWNRRWKRWNNLPRWIPSPATTPCPGRIFLWWT